MWFKGTLKGYQCGLTVLCLANYCTENMKICVSVFNDSGYVILI